MIIFVFLISPVSFNMSSAYTMEPCYRQALFPSVGKEWVTHYDETHKDNNNDVDDNDKNVNRKIRADYQ